jgi:flagellar biosynthesis/type III secretory pathway chaperone
VADEARIQALLARESAGVERLWVVLQGEHEALTRRDVEALDQLVADKQQCIADLEQVGREQRELLEKAGLAPDRSGLETLLQRMPGVAGETLRAAWTAIHQKLAACQQQNLANGRLLEGNRRFAQQALTALLGAGGDAVTELYDRGGATSLARGNRSYAKA